MDPSEASRKTWGELGEGVHICSIHHGEEEKFSSILPFFRSGFDKQEKCMYIYENDPPHMLYSEFDHQQTYPEDLKQSRQMEIVPYSETYTKNGSFEPDTVIEMFRQTLNDSLEKGYKGLRAAGDMDWVLSTNAPIEKYLEYEMKLNAFFPEKKLMGICQFDAQKFSREFLIDMILTHPYIILDGRLYQNRYFYTNPRFTSAMSKIPEEDYQTIVSIISEEEPLIA